MFGIEHRERWSFPGMLGLAKSLGQKKWMKKFYLAFEKMSKQKISTILNNNSLHFRLLIKEQLRLDLNPSLKQLNRIKSTFL